MKGEDVPLKLLGSATQAFKDIDVASVHVKTADDQGVRRVLRGL